MQKYYPLSLCTTIEIISPDVHSGRLRHDPKGNSTQKPGLTSSACLKSANEQTPALQLCHAKS